MLVPTHSRPLTLEIAVASALNQTIRDVEVLIIGDGATGALRAKALELCAADPRVRFFDHPKGAHHGEHYRHDAIMAARSDAIFYLCDDDIFMPTHVEQLLGLLETKNFVQSMNGSINPAGEVDFYPADLSNALTIEWHLRDDVRYNSVSITGTAHTKSFYLQIDDPWTTTPPDHWPDHYQARKFFRHPARAAATSRRMTALQLPTTQDGRSEWTEEERLVELRRWADLAQSPDGQRVIDELVAAGVVPRMERDYRRITAMHSELTMLMTERSALLAELDVSRNAVLAMMATWSWRLTRPLRFVRRMTLR
ncbi:glycosyltransferase [Salinibacterium sp.]|uniref:glycosyltransferase family 2 protein n=1 Tax=Salinibacterium sp. TaxID=1915057 RepID=UPI00286AC3EB|nr:glycosyltransferase [Salinibacterium sp.]